MGIKEGEKVQSKGIDTTNSFSKVAGYKINLQKSLAFLYGKNEQMDKEYRKIALFTKSQNIKYLGINLTKDMKDLYKEKQ
jgi:hypothetical protein